MIGPGTKAIAGEGRILTAGGFDCHVHFICPQQVEEALRRHHEHAGLAGSLDDLGSVAPLIDLLSMPHDTQYTRLFRS